MQASDAQYQLDRFVAQEYFGFDLDEREFARLAAEYRNVEELLPALFQQPNMPYEEILAHIRAHQADFPREPYDDTVPTLNALLQAEVPFTIVTGGSRAWVETDMARLEQEGIDVDHIALIQPQEGLGLPGKPHPAALQPSLEVFAERGIVDRAEIAKVGDDITDLQAAHGAGIPFIGVTTGRTTAEEFQAAGAELIVPRLHEILRIIHGEVEER